MCIFLAPNFQHLVCVWVQIFFYAFAFAFCVSKRWDPCYNSNAFSGMAATFSLDATTLSLMQQLFYWNGIAQWVPCTVHGTHKSLYLVTFSLKIGLMVLFTHLKIILLQYFQFSSKLAVSNGPLVCVWEEIKNENYFAIQLSFVTIHRPHCTFWHYS